MELGTCNLLNCTCCVQRRGVVELAPGEGFCDCRYQFGKWARIPRFTCPPGLRFDEHADCGSQGENVEDVDVVLSLSDHTWAKSRSREGKSAL